LDIEVHIDFETFSELDLTKVGLHNYVTHPSTDIICMAYKIEGKATELWRPNEKINFKEGYTLIAHNAAFELAVIREIGRVKYGIPIPDFIVCTAAQASMMGYPRSLGKAAKAMKLSIQKDEKGKRQMLQITKSRKPSKDNPSLNWLNNKEKLEATYLYCINDVNVECLIKSKTNPLPDYEIAIYSLDAKINNRGIRFDRDLAEAALDINDQYIDKLNNELFFLSGFTVSSVTKVQNLLLAVRAEGVNTPDLRKSTVSKLLESNLTPTAHRMLEIRQNGSKTSIAKYRKMLQWGSSDDRLRNLFLYHGAGTGRWTGKGPQLHNLPQGEKMDKQDAIQRIKTRDIASLEDFSHPPMVTLSSCIREAMTASEGNILGAADFKSIEVRVLAWLAGESALLGILRAGGDPYIDIASSIYSIPVAAVTPEQRNLGKMAILGLGYQMGSETFKTQCDIRGIDITEGFAIRVIKTFRMKYKNIVKFWKSIEKEAIKCKRDEKTLTAYNKFSFFMFNKNLLLGLPSGRFLYYIDPLLEQGKYGPKISHKRVNSITSQWERRDTYGGMLTENIVQAIARDLLAEAMLRVEKVYPIVLHVHDELVVDVPEDFDRRRFESLVKEVPKWAEGIPIEIDTWYQYRYQKG